MPILDIEIVIPNGDALPPDLAGRLADAAAKALQASPERTWVRLRSLAANAYAEGGGGPPPNVQPVFVQVLKATVPAEKELRSEAAALAAAIASVTRHPEENVHVLYLPPATGRIAFGGQLVGSTE